MKTDPTRRAQIRERIDGATKGPWTFSPRRKGPRQRYERQAGVGIAEYGTHQIGYIGKDEDAEFCSSARTDLPDLLDDLEEALKLNEGLQRLVAEFWKEKEDDIRARVAAMVREV